MTFDVFFPDTPPIPLPGGHRFPAQKYGLLIEAIRAGGILDGCRLAASPVASPDLLGQAHDPDYIAAMLAGTIAPSIMSRIGLPWSQVLVDRSRATVGGTFAAAAHALVRGVSGQLAGGTHHAHRDSGAGFCVFNDCAVAALSLLARGDIERAGVLDLDVHHGDGNASILGPDRRVFVASVHGANNYPFEKPPSDLDIGLPDGTGDDDYLAACDRALDAVVGFAPDLAFYIAGVDPLSSDRLGRLDVTHAGLAARDRRVLSVLHGAGVPVVILIGGGYGEPICDTVTAYANTWRVAREVFG
jgi:acetoin utilization deacetylase AcuC-like enzyme